MNDKITMQIKYLGFIDQMDINVLLTSLLHITNILEETNKFLIPDKKLKINITAVEKGSFIVNIELIHQILNSIKSFFSDSEVQGIGIVLTAFIEILKLKKETKGEMPRDITKKDDNIIINNNITVNTKIYQIYSNNEKVNSSIQKTFEAIGDDPSIDGFEIKNLNEKNINFRVDRNKFSVMQGVNKLLEEQEKIIEKDNVNLTTLKVVFEIGRKWEFLYEGFKISAKIIDECFFKNVISGEERFGKGDILKANIKITQFYDEEAKVYVNKEFLVTKILHHIQMPEEPKLF